jgi:hypothetical protein
LYFHSNSEYPIQSLLPTNSIHLASDFIKSVFLSCLAQQPLVLIIDGSSTARGCVTLMVSVVYQKRSLPLLWVTRKGNKRHFPEALHTELITAIKAIIPK